MVRLVIAITAVSVIVIAGIIIYIIQGNGPVEPNHTPVNTTSPPINTVIPTKRISINAIPWARVFIRLPQGDNFIEPRAQDFTIPPDNGKNANVTPIRGGLKLPVGTTIQLVYQEKEEIFHYEEWKDEETISHDFLNQ